MGNDSFYKIGLFVLILIFSACQRKEGCVDQTALNYCDDCTRGNNECMYTFRVQFWFDSVFSKRLVDWEVNRIKIIIGLERDAMGNFIKDSVIGYYNYNEYLTIPPICPDSVKLVYYEIEFKANEFLKDVCSSGGLFGSKVMCRLFSYHVLNADTTGQRGVLDDGYFTAHASNTCINVQIQ